jgi:hypothetical protein
MNHCPVCFLPLDPVNGFRIPRHRNTIGHWCELSGKDFHLVEVGAE